MSESHTQNQAAEWLNYLQANGHRLTAPRRVVVETLASSQRILSPLDVYESGRERYPGLGLVTVYRTIEKLEELGLLQRVHQTSGCHGFISAFSGHQHLLICQECGLVEFFSGEDENMGTFMAAVEQQSGFRLEEHWLQLFGVCAKCRQDDTRK